MVAVPYTLITFLRFCTSSHQSIAHGRKSPIIKKIKHAAASNKKKSLTISTSVRYKFNFVCRLLVSSKQMELKNSVNPLLHVILILSLLLS
jgi:hypothetical protein